MTTIGDYIYSDSTLAADIEIAADTTAPVGTIATPSDGDILTIGALVTLSANASDNVAVAGITFEIDGVALGTEITSLPYQRSWDTSSVSTGSHTISIVTRDTSDNTSTHSISVTFEAAASPFGAYVWSDATSIQEVAVQTSLPQVPAPIINPAGGIINTPRFVTISVPAPHSDADIRFTLDGTTPSASSPLYVVGGFEVDRSLTVKAIAIKSGMANSNITIATFELIVSTVATPSINPSGGNFTSPVVVSITTVTPGAEIHYTTNGGIPSSLSPLYTGAFILSDNTEIKAVAIKTGWLNSAIASSTFNIVIETEVADPQITPAGGIFVDPITVNVGTTTVGATLHYTLDGSLPDTGSNIYTAPIVVANTLTLKVFGRKSGLDDSNVVSANFIIQATSFPTNLIAVNNVNDPYGTSAVITWSSDALEGLSGFKILYGTSTGNYTEEIEITDPLVRSRTITGLDTNTTYYFAMKSVFGAVESGMTGEVSCFVEDVIKPPAPTNFVASITADGRGVWLRWENPTVDFSHVVLVKNADHVPATPTDGEVIYTGTNEEYTDEDI